MSARVLCPTLRVTRDLAPVVLVLALLGGCSHSSEPVPPRGNAVGPQLPAAGSSAPSTAPTAGLGSIDMPGTVTTPTQQPMNAGAGMGSAGRPADGCVGTSVTAPPASNPQVDIVWVVDASGSMLDEQMKIGANLTEFANAISMASVDVHIVMMTTSAAIPVICPVTSPDPLAGSPLASDPRYKFIDSLVDSHNLLDVAVNSYPQYSGFLRKGAALHFMIVSDDESTYKRLPTPADRAQTFKQDMTALVGKDFALHTISSDGPTACRDPNCMPDPSTGICVFVMLGCGAAAPGATYYALARDTHGLTASICESDWKSIFTPLTVAVIESAPLPCNYSVPMPPHGEHLDPAQVNVHWIAPMTNGDVLWPKAATSAACGDALGWYYDDAMAPKQVLLCPHSCDSVANGGTLSLSFGCRSIELK